MTLILRAIKGKGEVVEYGRIEADGTMSGKAKGWYNRVKQEFPDAPNDLPAFMEWADKRFNGSYFNAELER